MSKIPQETWRDFLVVQWLRLSAFPVGGMGSTTSWGTEIQKKKKFKYLLENTDNIHVQMKNLGIKMGT